MVDSVDYNTNNTQATSFTQNNYSDSPNHHNNYNNDNSFVYEHNYNNGNVASSTALLEEEQLNSCLKKPQTNHSNGSIGKVKILQECMTGSLYFWKINSQNINYF